ncbi:MAG: histidine phosphatase family protein [Rhodopila sp.]
MWIIRHGESAGNVARYDAHAAGRSWIEIETRDADVRLSQRGERQADALGRWFAAIAQAEQPDVVLTSPYVRARQTAERICRGLRTNSPLLVDERLREKELGILDRLTDAGLGQLQPQQAELRRHLGKFYHRPPGGESWCDVILRLRSTLDTISLHYAGRRVLIVCHQVVVLCFRYLLEELDEQKLLAIDAAGNVANCSVTEYGLASDTDAAARMLLRRYNFVAPLAQEAVPITAPDPQADAP